MENIQTPPDLPNEFWDIFGAVKNQHLFLKSLEIYLHETLMDTFETRKRLVHQRIAPIFFFYTTHLFHDQLVLSIAKLLDRSKTYRSPNASLSRLIESIPEEHANTINHLTNSLEIIKENAERIIKHRNKRISHNDYSVYALNNPLPAISENEFMKTLRGFEDFLNYIEVNLLGGTPVDYSAAEIREEAQRLFAFLKRYTDSPI